MFAFFFFFALCHAVRQIHWLSIINSFVLVVILTVFLGIILLRILKNDFTRYMDGDEVMAGSCFACCRLGSMPCCKHLWWIVVMRSRSILLEGDIARLLRRANGACK